MKTNLNELKKLIKKLVIENIYDDIDNVPLNTNNSVTFDTIQNYIYQNNIKKNDIKFTDPKFEFEWEEAKRYEIFDVLGKNFYLDKARQGYTVNLSEIKNNLTNASLPSSPEDAAGEFNNLTSDRRERLLQAFQNRKFEKSIAIKLNNHRYDLMAGNTRLVGLAIGNIDHEIWIIDLSDIVSASKQLIAKL